MSGPRPLGVAVIGLGVGEQHVRAYAAHPACRVLSVYDLERRVSERLANEIGARVATSETEVFEDAAIDVVSIASYDAHHARQVRTALGAGKHVFVEKPLCRSSEELRAIKHAWSGHPDRHLASNLVLRAAPLYRWLHTAITSGELGSIYAFDGDYLFGRLHKITEGWRSQESGYSVMLGGGVHLVDLMMWLTGERPAQVFACGNRISTRGTAFHYDDFAAASYQFPSGLVGRVTANFGCVHRHQHVVRVFGTRGTFVSDDAGARLHRARDPLAVAESLELAPLPASKGALIPEFVQAIVGGASPASIVQAELDLIAACAAADCAMASGEPGEIRYV
jgi:predicted dehydrogenase